MARVIGAQENLVRIKSGSADDPDIVLPGTSLDGLKASDNPAEAFFWSVTPRRSDGSPLQQILLRVELRSSAGVELPGAFSVYAFSVSPVDESMGQVRPAVAKHGDAKTGVRTEKPMTLDVAHMDKCGLRLYDITPDAGTVAKVYIWAQEWK